MSEDQHDNNNTEPGDDTTQKRVVPYKMVLILLLCVLIGLVIARVAMALILSNPGDHQVECMRDLVRWVELILAALVGLIAGKAVR